MGPVYALIMSFFGLQACSTFGPLEDRIKEAIAKNNIKEIRRCIALGADLHQHEGQDFPKMGRTLLSYAINKDSVKAVAILLEAGVCVESAADLPIEIGIKLEERYLPHLSYAIAVGASLPIIKLLIKYSKDLNIGDPYHNRTPYEIAQHFKRKDVMLALKKAGAIIIDPQ